MSASHASGPSLKREVNAELGFVVPAPRMVWLFPFKAFGTVQRPENGVSLMQRHLLAVFQVGAFTPYNCDNRLGCRIMGNGLFRPCNGNFTFHLAFHKIVHVAVLHFVALFAQTVDKLHHLIVVAHGLGILHNQAAFPVAQTRAVLFGQLHQRGGPFRRGRLRHHWLFIQEAVNPIPCLRFFLLGLGPLQRPVVGEDKSLCLNSIQRALRHLAGGFQVCSMAFTLSVISCCCSGGSVENTLSGAGCSAACSEAVCSCWACRSC